MDLQRLVAQSKDVNVRCAAARLVAMESAPFALSLGAGLTLVAAILARRVRLDVVSEALGEPGPSRCLNVWPRDGPSLTQGTSSQQSLFQNCSAQLAALARAVEVPLGKAEARGRRHVLARSGVVSRGPFVGCHAQDAARRPANPPADCFLPHGLMCPSAVP